MAILSADDRRKIAGDARTLQERLQVDADELGADADVEESLDERLDEWREYVADGDPGAFRERLEREGIDRATCRRRLAAAGWPDDEPLPDWVEQLDEILEFVVANPSPAVDAGTDHELPFRDLVTPVVAYAHEQVGVDLSERCSASAVADLTGWLATRLTGLWSRALFIEFKTYVADRDPDLVFEDDVEPPAGSTKYYDGFVEEMLDAERLRSFFREYAFLGRLLVSVVRQWTRRVETFHARVSDDRAALREAFGGGEDLGEVAEIGVFGDHHHDGRTVLEVTFASGTTVAYKPRNAGIVAGFYDLVEWINDRGDFPDLRTLTVLYRAEYAWMEWVRPAECDSREAVADYYRRAGMLMCLFYALAATDMHLENIVAEGDQPVPVDLETVTEPIAKPETRRVNEAVEVVADTVVRTGVVPRHVPGEDVGDMAGFSVQQGSIEMEAQRFTDVNTDRMDLVTAAVPDREGENLPVYDGRVVGPREHADAIVDGFAEMYRFVLDERAALLADDGPIAGLTDREARLRVVYRPTAVYSRIGQAMRSVKYLRTGLRFGVRAEVLAKLLVAHDVDPVVWSVYEAERDVLRRCNTPRFTAEMRSRDLYDGDGDDPVVEEFFVERPIDQVRERIRAFDPADLAEQCEYLRWGYGEYEERHGRPETTQIRSERDDLPDLDGTVEAAARGVFDRVEASSRTADGRRTWVLRRVGADGGIDVHPIRDSLYDGRVGVGLFAAGLSCTLGDRRYEAFARETVAPILDALEDGSFENDPDSVRTPPRSVGGAGGLGSILYGLTKVGELLDDAAYVDAATCVSELLEPRIEADEQYDVLQGSAGAVLGLLSLYEATGDDDVLARARRAGEHLLASATERDGAPTWAPAAVGRPLCGFAHGAAGIAFSLARLADVTGEGRFGTAAREALSFERDRYDGDAQNWPDLRASTDGEWMDAWCHGRTGVGLARLGTYELDATDGLRRDAERALRGLDPSALAAADHVCCGNFGRVEFLLRASRTLDEPAYRRDAERLAAACVRRADDAGRFSTQWGTEHWHDPTFFVGEAGIGYSLLRLRDPSLPCALLWE